MRWYNRVASLLFWSFLAFLVLAAVFWPELLRSDSYEEFKMWESERWR